MINADKFEGKVDVDEVLLGKLEEYLLEEDISVVSSAYGFAENAHRGQFRLSGEPFFEHPKQTALFLADLKLDTATISAALLHDVVEDCGVSYEQITDYFGADVCALVNGVTKLTKAELPVDPEEYLEGFGLSEEPADDLVQAETLRKMLVAMAEDIRVVLIKLADRLHNMRTVSFLPPERSQAFARETLEIFAPLAHRLGIWELKWMLEDLAFQQLNPKQYKDISKRLNSKRIEREAYIERVVHLIRTDLASSGIDSEVYGRPKHIYSIHKKTEKYAEQNKEISEIYDLFAVRILVDDLKDCYGALGVIHTKWHPLPGQFDDYIANPKDNLYQSLHTSVLCEDASPVEVQIRTKEMHKVAEYGVAAHWLYKELGVQDDQFDAKMRWLRQLLEWQRDASGAVEFVESFKTDIFQSQVFVYTPQGDVVELPTGATPLDFAYRVHTDVGHSCVGSKVNGKLVALNHVLSNGDTVQIMTSKTTSGPSRDWMNAGHGYVKTSSAKAKMRQWFNRQEKRSNIDRGKEILQRLLQRLDLEIDELKVANALKFSNTDGLLASLGEGSLTTEKLIKQISFRADGSNLGVREYTPPRGPASGIEVLGVGDLLTTIARCCSPIMGDSITGYITRGRGVTIHRDNCPNILGEDESERLVSVNWGETKTLYPVRIQIKGWDRVGLLGDVTSAVSEERVNIANIFSEEYDDMSVISLTVYVSGIEHLNKLYTKIESINGITEVLRSRRLENESQKDNGE